MLETVNLQLQSRGVRITTGTIVDATIIHAPSSTKNREGKRDPEMHQTKKGNQWYFGMKAHVGVDSKTKMIHTVVATAANVADATVLPQLRQQTRCVNTGRSLGGACVGTQHALPACLLQITEATTYDAQNHLCRRRPAMAHLACAA